MSFKKLPRLIITNRQYFRDDGMYIDGLTDGTLNITSDSAITLDGNVSLTTGDTFTVVDGAVDLGTGAITHNSATATSMSGLTLTGDLRRRYVRYISGTTTASGWERATDYITLPDEGVIVLSGKSGNITGKMPSPTPGRIATIVYVSSGLTGTAQNAQVSGSFRWPAGDNDNIDYFIKFDYPGEMVTLIGGDTYWYTYGSGNGLGPSFHGTVQ